MIGRLLGRPPVWAAILILVSSVIALGPALLVNVDQLEKGSPAMTSLMRLRIEQAEKKNARYKPRSAWVPLYRVSPEMQKAVLAAEDDGFYRHNGVEWKLMRDALIYDLRQRKFSRGASTITQQVAKNLFLSPSKNPLRKLKELIIAFRLERRLKKDRILEIYLNVAEWGNGIFGVETAAQTYFGVRADDLGWEEAIALAAVLPSPRKHTPVDGSRWVEKRKEWVRRRLLVNRWLPVEPETEELRPLERDEEMIPEQFEEPSADEPFPEDPSPPAENFPPEPDEDATEWIETPVPVLNGPAYQEEQIRE